jgi:rhomboid protease GluP
MMNDPQNRHPLDEPRKRHPLEEGPVEITETEAPGPRIALQEQPVPPLITYAMVAINVVIFAVGFLVPEINQWLFAWGVSSPREVLLEGEYYRLVSAMFLHGGLLHILFNAYALYIIGSAIEPVFGHTRFAIIYLLGGLGGSVLSVITGDPATNIGSVGASGAVFALFGAEMVFLYRNRDVLGARGRAQFRNLLFLLAINFFIGISSSFEGARVRIDNWGHLGGLLGGLVLTWFIGPILKLREHPLMPGLLVGRDINPFAASRYTAVLGVAAFLVLALIIRVVTLL